jgi:SAM-dependent methyltransferase
MSEKQNEPMVWADYYQQCHGRPPRDTLVKALELFSTPLAVPFAIDLGCGAGQDTLALLQAGWRVLAIDAEPEAIMRVRAVLPSANISLETMISSFETLTALPLADLVNASFCLPFCYPAHFETLWHKIVAALPVNGRFAGNFFGPNDSWANNPQMTFNTRAQIDALFQLFEIEFFREDDEDGQTACGKDKHWHVFSVVARKRP